MFSEDLMKKIRNTTTCARCDIAYPPDLLSGFYGNGDFNNTLLCGICALEISEEMRLSALKFREEHNLV